MGRLRRFGKIILFDFLAILCFTGVALFGWLPGPGGIPLLIAGLSLLAVNHDWAERLLERTKLKGKYLKQYIFPDDPFVRHFYDAMAVTLIVFGVYVLLKTGDRIVSALSVTVICFALLIFLINRDRFDKFSTIFKKKK